MNPTQALYTSSSLPQTKRIMVKDEDVCLHCGLCAERCPTAAWDMRQFELLVPYAAGRAASHMSSVVPQLAMPAATQAVQNV
jgi:ferredoxin